MASRIPFATHVIFIDKNILRIFPEESLLLNLNIFKGGKYSHEEILDESDKILTEFDHYVIEGEELDFD